MLRLDKVKRTKQKQKEVIKRLALNKRINVISRISVESSIGPVGLSAVPDGLKVFEIRHDFFPPQHCNRLLILFQHTIQFQLQYRVVFHQVRQVLLTVGQIPSQLFIILNKFPVHSIKLVNLVLYVGHLFLLLNSALLYFGLELGIKVPKAMFIYENLSFYILSMFILCFVYLRLFSFWCCNQTKFSTKFLIYSCFSL